MSRMKQGIKEIVLAGTPICVYLQENFLVTIDGLEIFLPRQLFKLTSLLILWRMVGDGWVERSELFSHRLNVQYIWRIRASIKYRVNHAIIAEGNSAHRYLLDWKFYEAGNETDNPDCYRLAVDPRHTRILIGPDLAKFEDDAVQAAAKRFSHLKTPITL